MPRRYRLHGSKRRAALRRSQLRLGTAIAISTLVGLCLGIALDNAPAGAAVGLTLGLAIGLLVAG